MEGPWLHCSPRRGKAVRSTPSMGRAGFYAAHAWRQGWSRERVTEGLGVEWKCPATSFKVYPAGGMIQAANDCTLELVTEHDIRPEEVEAVEVVVPGAVRSRARSGARGKLRSQQPVMRRSSPGRATSRERSSAARSSSPTSPSPECPIRHCSSSPGVSLAEAARMRPRRCSSEPRVEASSARGGCTRDIRRK